MKEEKRIEPDAETRAEEKRLAIRAAAGDADAFEILVGRYEKTVFHSCYLTTGNAEDAYDLSQEVFLKLWRGLSAYRGDASFFSWLYFIIRSVCADWVRKKKITPKTIPLEPEPTEDDTPPPQPVPADNDPETDPEARLLRTETQSAVRGALAALPPAYRILLTLCDLEGKSYQEAAALLSLNIGTVKSRLFRARKRLGAALSEILPPDETDFR